MRAPRSLPASFSVSGLVLSCALALPAFGQGLPSVDSADWVGIAPPDPPAVVKIGSSDLRPGSKAHGAVSKIVADPGRILDAYAPTRRSKAVAAAASKPTILIRPATLAPLVPTSAEPKDAQAAPTGTVDLRAAVPTPVAPAPPPPPTRVVALGSVSVPGEGLVAARPAAAPDLPAPHALTKTEANPAPVPVIPATAAPSASAPPSDIVERKTDPEKAVQSEKATEPLAAMPTFLAEPHAPVPPAAGGVLDAGTLQSALDAYVGPEPVPVGGRVSIQDLARSKDRQAVRTVYAARNFAPLWIEDGKFNAKARSVLARLDHAADDGLDLRSSVVVVPKDGDAAALARSELTLTEAAIAYGWQASGGRIDPSRIGALIASKPDVADPARILNALMSADEPGEALYALNPPQRGYALLRSKLAELRQTSNATARAAIPFGPMLKLGMRDGRVPLIRARFGLDMPSADAEEGGLVYDIEVAAAIADFQKAHHLPASGVLTIRTVAALSGGDPKRLEDEIVANMERWRWVPRDMGENRIVVNIPDFTVNVMHGDSIFHHARVVVGQPDKPTPVFSETMQFIIVNPYWNVPLSIVKKEMLPKLAADPNYFVNHGYETVQRDGQTYVRQPPGDSNALGRIKFMFPNKYSVYLHDTNSRSLFGNDRRALSHGCVRVDAPFKFAEAVLGKENGWTETRVKQMIGGKERTISLPKPLPIHIVYFTAFVDESGALQLRDDVYGYSGKLKAALGLGGPASSGQIAVN